MPLHSSQKITQENQDTFTIELFMHPTNNFIMEIMRHGAICEVKEPQELREKIQEQVNEMYERYRAQVLK